ncbi:ATP-binding protein [Chloroflexota bacterium]
MYNSDVNDEEWTGLTELEWKRKVLAEADGYARLIAASGYPSSVRFRRILEYLLSPLEAKVCTQIIWTPIPPQQIARNLDIDIDTVEKTLNDLHIKGLIHPRDFRTGQGFRYRLSTGKLHKSTLSNPNLNADYPELAALWSDFIEGEEGQWQCISRLIASERNQPAQRRILPAWKALDAGPDRDRIQPWEDQRAIAAATELCVEIPCPCRVQIAGSGGVCERTELDACLLFDREAEYALSKGIGRVLSSDELLALLEQASYDGMAGSYPNSRAVPPLTLCYCCDCCCHLWMVMKRHGVSQQHRGWVRSRWRPQIDANVCDGCGVCSDKCPWQAIEIINVDGEPKAAVDTDKCWGCGGCALWCGAEVIQMRCVRPEEWVPQKVPNLHPPQQWMPPRIVGATLAGYLDKKNQV